MTSWQKDTHFMMEDVLMTQLAYGKECSLLRTQGN